MFWTNAPNLDMLVQKIDGMLAKKKKKKILTICLQKKIDDMFNAKEMLLA